MQAIFALLGKMKGKKNRQAEPKPECKNPFQLPHHNKLTAVKVLQVTEIFAFEIQTFLHRQEITAMTFLCFKCRLSAQKKIKKGMLFDGIAGSKSIA